MTPTPPQTNRRVFIVKDTDYGWFVQANSPLGPVLAYRFTYWGAKRFAKRYLAAGNYEPEEVTND